MPELGAVADQVTFREAVSADLEALFELKVEAFSEEFRQFDYGQFHYYQEAIRTCCIEHADEGAMFAHEWHKIFTGLGQYGYGNWSYIITLNDRIIGAVCGLPGEHSGENYAGIPMQDYNVLICIYVHPEYKNRGIGEKALAFMEQQHSDRPWILTTPEVSEKNQYFYRKCGYNKIELTDGRFAFTKPVFRTIAEE